MHLVRLLAWPTKEATMSKSKVLARQPIQLAQDNSMAALTADEQRLVNALRALPAGEPRNFVLRYTEALRDKLAAPLPRPRLSLVENRNTE